MSRMIYAFPVVSMKYKTSPYFMSIERIPKSVIRNPDQNLTKTASGIYIWVTYLFRYFSLPLLARGVCFRFLD